MAANKFATILHRNTHWLIFLLIYTVLEWILIILLLLNALFSYMISKFASFFGLLPPCIFCSRIDHIFEPGRSPSSCGDFFCDSHAGEVSKLGFCSNHRRLADAGDMCEDCAASKPGETDRGVALLSWMKRSEQGEKDLRCSCCSVALESGFYSPYLLFKADSWDVLEFGPREKSGKGEGFGLKKMVQGKELKDKEEEEEGKGKGEAFIHFPPVGVEDALVDIISPRADKMVVLDRIHPVELIDSSTMVKSLALEILRVAGDEKMSVPGSEKQEIEQHSYVLVPTEEPCDDFSMEFKVQQVSAEDGKGNDEANCEISIGSEICDQEQIEPTQFSKIVSLTAAIDHQNLNVLNETTPNDPVTETEPSEQTSQLAKHLNICPFLNETEEERIMPETPTTPNYMDNNFHFLHKRFLLERRESGTESLDGSIASDIDNPEPATIDHLKTALKSERKALIALYAELEEERSASAIATNQTMAMITRLQEEKAAMQMEALQYQRMMEEQSEYDQEALQLLNELMMKREKEKQELKKELEVYQHKVRVYAAIERRKMAKGSRSGTSSSAEESDEMSVESQNGNQNSMDDDDDVRNLITLDESLAEFEEERLAILEQLKVLEEKLFTMDDEHDSFNSKHMKQLQIENCNGINGDYEYGYVNGSFDIDQKSAWIGGKRLNPLFDAIGFENEDRLCINHKQLAIAEEVDHVYERLQALEADREFLKHCLSSLKKGERGTDLLQEILHHLRDLRTVELCSRHIDA